MWRLPARTAPRALRALALTAVFFVLAVGCGHETFDLVPPSSSGSAGMLAAAGQSGGGIGAGGSSGLGGGGAQSTAGGGAAGSSGGSAGRGGSSGSGPCLPGQSCGEGGAPTCPATVFSCKRCATSKECTEGDSPFCDQAVGRCTQCRPGGKDCGPFEVCNPFTRRCATACEGVGDCAFDQDSPLCDKDVGACVSCTMNSHCGGYRRTCYLGLCVECDGTSAAQCPADRPYCVALRCQRKQQ